MSSGASHQILTPASVAHPGGFDSVNPALLQCAHHIWFSQKDFGNMVLVPHNIDCYLKNRASRSKIFNTAVECN